MTLRPAHMRPRWPALLLVLGLMPASLSAQDATLRLEVEDRTTEVSAHRAHGYSAFPLASLEPLGGRVTENPVGAVVELFGDTLAFESHSPFFRAGGGVHQLTLPAYRVDGSLYVPAQLFAEWLPERYPERLSWQDGTLRGARISDAPADAGRDRGRGGAAPTDTDVPTAGPAPSGSGSVRVVVIDPGHGGRDPGKIGPGGVREKDVTLAVARRLAAELERRGGYEVHLTRRADTLVALGDRPHMANEWKAGRPLALFVSVHANSHRVTTARGFETYFLSEARTEDERRVAEMENEAVRYEAEAPTEAVSDLALIANHLKNDFYQRASNDLAEVVQRNMAAFHPGPNRGVKQAGFRVLVGAFMPAVLVELAFISHRDEARLLATSAFQDKLTWSLANAVDEFFDGNEARWAAGAGR